MRSSLLHSISAINQTDRKRKIHEECTWNSGQKHHWVIRKLFVKYYERNTVGGGEEGQGWEQGGLQVTAAAVLLRCKFRPT